MPTIEDNKLWANDLERFENEGNNYRYYGQHWGDPQSATKWRYWIQQNIKSKRIKRIITKVFGKDFLEPIPGDLSQVVRHYIKPYIKPDKVVLEVGPGGGRWTQYFLKAKKLILVELNPIFFSYLEKRFPESISKFQYYQTQGDELAGIDSNIVDYVFVFGVFVHLEYDVIERYVSHFERVMRQGGIAVIQYADKTKLAAAADGFSNMNVARMEEIIFKHPSLDIMEHNAQLLNHSNIVLISKK